MTAVQDQQPVKTLCSDRSDEALGDRVRLRRSHRRLHDPDLLAVKELIERPAVLSAAVADHEADALVCEVEAAVCVPAG